MCVARGIVAALTALAHHLAASRNISKAPPSLFTRVLHLIALH